MADNSIILYLFVATFAAVIIYGIVQLIKVRKAKEKNTHSAMGDGPRREAGTPPSKGTPPR